MTNRAQLDIRINDDAELLTEYNVESKKEILFPCEQYDTGVNLFTTAYIMDLVHVSDGRRHTVGILYNGEEFSLTCGDGYLEGKNSKIDSVKRVDDIMSKLTFFDASKLPGIKTELSNQYGTYQKNAPCGFWRQWKSATTTCKHINHMFAEIKGTDVLDELVTTYNSHKVAAAPVIVKTTEEKFLERFSFKKHVKFTGPKGSGKTYGVHKYLDDIGIAEENRYFVGGNSSIEAYQLLGSLTPMVREIKEEVKNVGLVANKSFSSQSSKRTKHIQDLVWKNGPLTAAFKKAATGERAVLFIDEILRIPHKEQSILISALTPDNKGYFTLRTEKMVALDDNGDGIEEVIKCKKENLWVIATTNIGANYDVEEVDDAFEDRFITFHKVTERDTIKNIITAEIKARKFKNTAVKSMMEFYDKMTNYRKIEQLSKLLNTRHLCEVIEIATKQSEIKEILKDYVLVWVDRDHEGEPEQEQIKLVHDTINSVF